ncbi:MAG TPA: response regulator [Clostridiaceae bacterium]|nr:response regulator [Clostridiaceae bacterium]
MKRDIILCVDDEEMMVEALKIELTNNISSDIIIETATSAEEALMIVNESLEQGDHIILVISDQKMPEMTGEVLLAELDKIIPQALKILLTGYTDLDAIQYAINNASLFRYIQKPWEQEDLILTVKQAIDKFNTMRALDEKTRQIMKMNEELEEKVQERTMQLSDAIKELETFSFTVSHDLKSPLRSIDYCAKYILEDYADMLSPEVLKMLTDIRSTCENMFILINKLLLYSMTANALPELAPVDTDQLFRQTYAELMSSVKNRKIEFIIKGVLPTVMADSILLKQVVNNILSNAIKFTRLREKAVITVDCEEDKNKYRFSVRDNGVGFDMKYASKLFGIFQRMHTQNEYEGSGIGLATVKKIIDKHGGEVSINSVEDEGTVLSFTLPKQP